jgi:hypothetical protein
MCVGLNGKTVQRSHVVLLASGQARPSPQHTADHIVPSQHLNDSITNLRWATGSEQRKNQGDRVPSATFETASGANLPDHPKWGKAFKLTFDGLIKVGNGDWTHGCEDKNGSYN